MSCRKPRTVGLQPDGKTIAWSEKTRSKEYSPFTIPCGKCISCRLDYARSWAVRAINEASTHEKNIFLTLTFSDENIGNNTLDYSHFQKFIRSLRDYQRDNNLQTEIGYLTIGEYGTKTKRMHWHSCLFNYEPEDKEFLYTSDSGHKVYTSKILQEIWGYGKIEFGSVTTDSASYCARYSLKKLTHSQEFNEKFKPIFRTSKKYAIGKNWLEKNYKDVIKINSVLILQEDGKVIKFSIPRYYKKWLLKNRPTEYVLNSQIHEQNQIFLENLKIEEINHIINNWNNPLTKKRSEVKDDIKQYNIKKNLLLEKI